MKQPPQIDVFLHRSLLKFEYDIVCYLGHLYSPAATITTAAEAAATAKANKEAEVRRLVIVSIPMVFL